MDDPLTELKHALKPLFSHEPFRNGKYTYTEIEQLKTAIDDYHPQDPETFKELVIALRAARPHFEKWGINATFIRNCITDLAKDQPQIEGNWGNYFPQQKFSPKFQYGVMNQAQQEMPLIPWLKAQAEAEGKKLTLIGLLTTYCEKQGVSSKLKTHLEKEPEFLASLIMNSEEEFSQIAKTRLILFLTDKQLAQAITKYLPHSLIKPKNAITQEELLEVDKVVSKLNDTLTKGRCVTHILENKDAIKDTLDKTQFYKIYKSSEYKNHVQHPPNSPELGGVRPGF